MTTISTPGELAALRQCPRAILFLDVEWSMTARRSRVRVKELAAAWAAQHPESPVEFGRIDVSDQSGPMRVALEEFLSSQKTPAGALMFGGNGALVWLREGRVVATLGYCGAADADVLVERTREIDDTQRMDHRDPLNL